MKVSDWKKVHCVGIGGIAISGIAKLLQARGVVVSGSDGTATDITRGCASLGIDVAIGHDANNVPEGVDVLIYSEAVPEDNVERLEARRRGVVELAGADALAALTTGKKLIAVSGTNGKSTTTAMIGLILEHAGWDPTVVVGSLVPGWPLGSARDGRGEWMVIEADEYARKMLKYRPDVAVITNIAEDHMDVYKDLDDVIATFQKFLDNIKPGGFAVLNAEDESSGRLHASRLIRFSTGDDMVRDWRLRVPGKFNLANAAAATAACRELGIGQEIIRTALESFRGIWRRFEVLGKWRGSTVVTDYAHHPDALRATLAAAREWAPGRRVVAVFQPHHHNRTRTLFHDFVRSFFDADVIVLTDVYDVAGREGGDHVDISELAAAVAAHHPEKKIVNGGSLAKLHSYLESLVQPGDLLLFLGAGDIDSLARSLIS